LCGVSRAVWQWEHQDRTALMLGDEQTACVQTFICYGPTFMCSVSVSSSLYHPIPMHALCQPMKRPSMEPRPAITALLKWTLYARLSAPA